MHPNVSFRALVAVLFWVGLALVALIRPPAVSGGGGGSFVDISDTFGFGLGDVTYGSGWTDFDDDGDLDLIVCRHFFRPIFYRNNGGGAFDSFVFFATGSSDFHGPVLVDIDNDGDDDMYFTAGSDAGASANVKAMYRNEGNFVFSEVAAAFGLQDSLARGRSTSAMDVDSDGDVDLFVSKAARVVAPNSLFLNNGSQNFTDVAASAGVADDFGAVGAIWGDYDRDGDPDLFVSGEEDFFAEARLYRNDGAVTFTNVTSQMLPGLGKVSAADFADYDGDGDLDLAVGLGDGGTFDVVTSSPDSLRFLFRSLGTDTGVDEVQFYATSDSIAMELHYNGFPNPDVIWISETMFHPPSGIPFRLDRDSTLGMPSFGIGDSIGIYVWTDSSSKVWDIHATAPTVVGNAFAGIVKPVNGFLRAIRPNNLDPQSRGIRGTRLFRNDGNVFTDITTSVGIADTANVRQVTWLDVDLDGNLDLYVVDKGDAELLNEPNILYRNVGGTFTDATTAFAMEGPEGGLADGASFADIDDDGDPDMLLLSGTGPRLFTIPAIHRLYRNDAATGNYLRIELEGTESTRDGLGAWVTCFSPGVGRQEWYVTRNAWRGGPVIADPVFGMGADTTATFVFVDWPSGESSLLENVPVNQTITVVEPSAVETREAR